MAEFEITRPDGSTFTLTRPESAPAAVVPGPEETPQRTEGPLSALINTITEFASPDPPGGPRRRMIPKVELLPQGLETAFQSFLLTAAPTAGATQLARQFATIAPRAAKFVPALTEIATSFLTRRQNVAAGFEEPGAVSDVLSVALPGASRAAGAGLRRMGQAMAPQMTREGAEQLARPMTQAGVSPSRLIQEGDALSSFQRGETVRRAAQQAQDELGDVANQAFGSVRQRVANTLQGELLDVTEIAQQARRAKITLDELGVEVIREGGRTFLPFDEAMKLSSKTFGRIMSRQDKDRILAGGLRRFRRQLDRQIMAMAERAGAGDELRQARRMFARDIAPRFRTAYAQRILDETRTSAEQIVNQAPSLTVRDARNLNEMLVNVGRELGEGGRAILSPSRIRQEMQAGVISRLLKNATNADTGQLQPGALLRQLQRIEPEAATVLLGRETADALQQFAQRLAQSQRRITFGIGAAGTAGLAALGAQRAGGIGAAASLEAANELNFLGRLLVGNPRVFRRLTQRVLRGEPEAIRDFTALTGLRIFGTQAGRPTGVPTPPPFPETASQPVQ